MQRQMGKNILILYGKLKLLVVEVNLRAYNNFFCFRFFPLFESLKLYLDKFGLNIKVYMQASFVWKYILMCWIVPSNLFTRNAWQIAPKQIDSWSMSLIPWQETVLRPWCGTRWGRGRGGPSAARRGKGGLKNHPTKRRTLVSFSPFLRRYTYMAHRPIPLYGR